MSTHDTGSSEDQKADAKAPESHNQPLLVIPAQDLPANVRAKVAVRLAGVRVLEGAHDDALTTLFDALPGVIARRLQRITPPHPPGIQKFNSLRASANVALAPTEYSLASQVSKVLTKAP
jgi:hypothetical protein